MLSLRLARAGDKLFLSRLQIFLTTPTPSASTASRTAWAIWAVSRYLVAIMGWFSRYVLAWELSNSMETDFCLCALNRALMRDTPGISNTDQRAQFTSEAYTGRLTEAGVRISMDGRGRALDNVCIERLWRSVKYEEVYLRDYANGLEAHRGLERYFRLYNTNRPHQSLQGKTPYKVDSDAQVAAEVYRRRQEAAMQTVAE